MTKRLQDKVAIVTGAASGIGLATARRFAQEGARIMLTDINVEAGEAAASALVGAGLSAAFMRHDVASASDWQAVMEATIASWGRLDILVNNAGIARPASVEDTTEAIWRQTLTINLDGVFFGTQAAIVRMKGNGGGSIVNLASIESFIGEPLAAAYNASKGGVRIFSKSAAAHCARQGYSIRVNCVCPGFVETPLIAGAVGGMPTEMAQQFQQKVLTRTPMGRLGQPEEIASAILFFASDEASYITGADLLVDGGLTCQ